MKFTWADIKHAADVYLVPFGTHVLVALLVFIIGRYIARALIRGLDTAMAKSKMDVSLRSFLSDVLYAALLVIVITAVLDTIGVKTTAVIAVLGAAGLAIGLALQGSLSNFAAGVMIIMLRPYKVGDTVVIGKYQGRVDAIKVFNTIIVTSDNREITIPNAQIIAAPIENMTTLGTRRVDILIKVGHGTDLRQIKQWLQGIVLTDQRVRQTPAAAIELTEVTDEDVRLFLRPWTNVEDYAVVAADTIERVKETLEANKVKFSVQLT